MKTADHPEFVYRVGRTTPWEINAPRGVNRFDIHDPEEPTTTIYTGETAEAALAEVMAPFRPDIETIAAVKSMDSEDGKDPASGIVPKNWLKNRCLGRAKIRPSATIVDITDPVTIDHLRRDPGISKMAVQCGFPDIDESSLKACGPKGRRFTQTVAAHLYSIHFSAIRYGSRLGETYHCIAGFVALSSKDVTESEFIIAVEKTVPLAVSDPALVKVAGIFQLKLPAV